MNEREIVVGSYTKLTEFYRIVKRAEYKSQKNNTTAKNRSQINKKKIES
jgi:hypothetical protein